MLSLFAQTALVAEATLVDFTGINTSAVSSPNGQNFAYRVGDGPDHGILNVHLLSGGQYSLTTGSQPDTKGFYALQSSTDLSELIFRFTFDTARRFIISENETQAALELNAFSLASGTWNVLSSLDTVPSFNGSTVTFSATNNSPPYGHYVISATGSYFDFSIKNSPGFPVYGSSISVEAVPDAVPEIDPASTASVLSLIIGSLCIFERHRRLR